MNDLIKNNIVGKIRKENFILLLLILFISAQSNIISLDYLTLIFVFLYATKLFIKRGIEIQFSIVLFTIIYLLSLLIYYFTFGWINILLSIRMLMVFILGYMAVKVLGEDFLMLYEKIIYVLAIISLILFPLQLLFYKDLFKIIGAINYLIPNFSARSSHAEDLSFVNIIVFSINSIGALRNSGFAWEPKGFGNFLIIAIVINIIQNRFKLNKKLIVLIVAVLTTISTDAYLNLFFLIPIFIMLNVKKSYFLLFIPILILAMFLSFQLPFMQKKIEREWKGRFAYKTALSDSRFPNKQISLGRMPSMMVDVSDFLKQPILGYGVQKNARTQSYYEELSRVNGLSNWLATFGIVGIIFLLLSHYYGFKKFLLQYNLRGQTILLLIILVIYFATNVITHPFWIMLQFLFVINYKEKNKFLIGEDFIPNRLKYSTYLSNRL